MSSQPVGPSDAEVAAFAVALRGSMLRDAASLVETVRKTLNTSKHECETCGLKKAESWPESLIAKELDATSQKLRRFADELTRGASS